MKSVYTCQQCGYRNPKWLGRCPACQQFNSMVEEVEVQVKDRRDRPSTIEKPRKITEVTASDSPRITSGIGEVDRVLGGGIVRGSVCLIGGDPGIGKSTLTLQMANRLSAGGQRILYVTAEESLLQVRLRAQRLGAISENLLVCSETNLEAIRMHLEEAKPAVAIIDSIQMVYRADVPSAPGSVSQVRECAAELTWAAKRLGISLFIITHVTKDGTIAGPRTLEHMVDAVFYFEGDRFQAYRILRSVKNRFGSTQEVGIFQMESKGLVEVPNPSELFMSADRADRMGSVIVPTVVGTRTLLVEIQALTSRSGYATPSRRVSGVDFNRVAMIIAVLERRAGLPLGQHDVFVNAVGGAQVEEPAADLATALAIVSNFRGTPVNPKLYALGEIGLGSEIRGVSQAGARVGEGKRLGFEKAIVPKDNVKGIDGQGVELVPVRDLREALEAAGLF